MADPSPRETPPHEAAPGANAPKVRSASLLHSIRELLATLLATLCTRGELLQTELEEERLRVAGIVVYAAVAAFFLIFGVLFLSVYLLLLFWDTHRLTVAGLLTLAYLLIGVICALIARQRASVKSGLFSASLAELRKDGERLRG